MNYFTIGGKRYWAEIREIRPPFPHEFIALVDSLDETHATWIVRRTRPAARRALKRELIRLATGPDGKRANWQIARRGPTIRIRIDVSRALHGLYRVSDAIRGFGIEAERASGAFGELNQALAQNENPASARKIIARAAAKLDVPVGEFVRRVRGEARS